MEELFNACRIGNIEIVKQCLLNNNISINSLYTLQGGYKQPPLFIASINKHYSLIEWLFKYTGCSFDTIDSDGENVFGILGRYIYRYIYIYIHILYSK